MEVDYYSCEVCKSPLTTVDVTQPTKFPAARQIVDGKTISVRCNECALYVPHKLEVGGLRRSYLIGREHSNHDLGWNAVFSCLNFGIGHLLEIGGAYSNDAMNGSIQFGFMEDSNMKGIVIGYRFGNDSWNVLPYRPSFYPESIRRMPSEDMAIDCEINVAFVDGEGGRYTAVRKSKLETGFCRVFNSAIKKLTLKNESLSDSTMPNWGNIVVRLNDGEDIFQAITTI